MFMQCLEKHVCKSQVSSHLASDSAVPWAQRRPCRTGRYAQVAETPPLAEGGDSQEAITGRSCSPLIPAALLAASTGPSLPHKGLLGARSLKLRLLGTQFAVNFHFLLPSSQGSAGPGKGDLRFVFYSKGGAGFSGHVGHKPSLGSTSSPSKTLLTLVTMPHCPHDNRHTHTCTRTHAHTQADSILYAAYSHIVGKHGSQHNTGWLVAGMGDISSWGCHELS